MASRMFAAFLAVVVLTLVVNQAHCRYLPTRSDPSVPLCPGVDPRMEHIVDVMRQLLRNAYEEGRASRNADHLAALSSY